MPNILATHLPFPIVANKYLILRLLSESVIVFTYGLCVCEQNFASFREMNILLDRGVTVR